MSTLEMIKMPVVKIAAIAVIIFCVVGIGAMTGLIPGVFPQNEEKESCVNCGVVESVKAVEVPGEGTGLGAITGGVVGAVVGSTIGEGRGKTLAEVAGAAGGAYAGHQIEKSMKKKIRYQVTVAEERTG